MAMNGIFRNHKPILLLAGFFTGIVNGLFGAGGGMLGVVALERLQGLKEDEAHATALIVMLPLTLVSITVYLIKGGVEWNIVPWAALGLLPGSFLGAKLLGNLRGVWINRLFCLVMLIAGLRCVLG